MGARGSNGSGRWPVNETHADRPGVLGRPVDARTVLRVAFRAPAVHVGRNVGHTTDDVGPELREVAERSHPF